MDRLKRWLDLAFVALLGGFVGWFIGAAVALVVVRR